MSQANRRVAVHVAFLISVFWIGSWNTLILADDLSAGRSAGRATSEQAKLSVRERLKAYREARHQRLTGRTEEATTKSAYAPGRLIIKYQDSVEACAHCLFASKTTFQRYVKDRSSSLDILHQALKVTKITPVFRQEPKEGRGAPLRHRDLKAKWQADLAKTQQRFPHAKATGKKPADFPDLSHIYVLEVPPETDPEATCKRYAADPHVAYCQPDYLMEPQAFPQTLPNDTYVDPDQNGIWSKQAWGQTYEDLWGLKKIRAHESWQISQGDGVIVAVVDSGVRDHEDLTEDTNGNGLLDPGEDQNNNGLLESNIWINTGEIPNNSLDDDGNGYVDDIHGWNFNANSNDTQDSTGHGTYVAGIIAALGNNGRGIIGVAPKAKIMPVKVAIRVGQDNVNLAENFYIGSSAQIAQAIVYAATNGADIINGSWTCARTCPSDVIIEDAVRTVDVMSQSLVVLAAGNGNRDIQLYSPQNLTAPKPLVVAASNRADSVYSSNFGTAIDIAAPGGPKSRDTYDFAFDRTVLSLKSSICGGLWFCTSEFRVGTDYVRFVGTSAAAAYASGVAALVRAAHPEFTNEDLRQVLRVSAVDVGAAGPDILTGAGRIDAAQALSIQRISRAKIDSPAAGVLLSPTLGTVEVRGTAAGDTFAQYSLSYGMENGTTPWTPIGTLSPGPVTNGVLAEWDIRLVPTGRYLLRLTVGTTDSLQFEDIVPIGIEAPVFRLTAPAAQEGDVTISEGQHVIWSDNRNGNWDLYACEYDPLRAQCLEQPLAIHPASQVMPAISGAHLVWIDGRLGTSGALYRCQYDPVSPACLDERQVSTDAIAPSNPAISENLIVWEDTRGLDDDVYFCEYDPIAHTCPGQPISVTDDAQYAPKTSGRWVVWEQLLSGAVEDNEEIYARNIDQVAPQAITNRPNALDLMPDISEPLIVWSSFDLDDWTAGGLDVHNLMTGRTKRISESVDILDYAISGNRIVWEDRGEIYFCQYDVATDECSLMEAITAHPAWQFDPEISGNLIVWRDERDGDQALYAYDVDQAPLIADIPDGSVNEGDTYAFTIWALDRLCDPVTLSARLGTGDSLSTIGASFQVTASANPCEVRGTFNWTPPATFVTPTEGSKDVQIILEATDGRHIGSETVTIAVQDVVVPDTSFRGVIQLANGTPIPFVHVKLSGKSTTDASVKLTVLTNAEGRYRFQNLPSGTYKLTARLKKYFFSPLSNLLWPSALPPVWTPFVPGPTIPEAGTLAVRGTLTGAPAAQVQLKGKTTTLQAVKLVILAGPDSTYTFEALPAGTYTVQPKLKGKTFTPRKQEVTVTTADATVNFTAP